MNLRSLAEGCAACRACKGAAYQTPPVLYAGWPDAPIIAVGQNPGEIKPTDKPRNEWIKIFEHTHEEEINKHMAFWYSWDFYGSPGHARLAELFGTDWLMTGDIAWTNAVRCRTKGNAHPSSEMMTNCMTWTDQLLEGRKAIIMVGTRARLQVLGEAAIKLEWGAPKKHPTIGFLLAIKHYTAWKGDDAKIYAEAVKRLKEKVL
jgi:uracil-DNA glycosylase